MYCNRTVITILFASYILLQAHFLHVQPDQKEPGLKNVNMHQIDSLHLYCASICAFYVRVCTKSLCFAVICHLSHSFFFFKDMHWQTSSRVGSLFGFLEETCSDETVQGDVQDVSQWKWHFIHIHPSSFFTHTSFSLWYNSIDVCYWCHLVMFAWCGLKCVNPTISSE